MTRSLTFSKDIMVQNIDSVLQRGERLDLLVDKTDTLAGQAYAFRRGARNVRRQQWWKNVRITALLGVVGIVSSLGIISECSSWGGSTGVPCSPNSNSDKIQQDSQTQSSGKKMTLTTSSSCTCSLPNFAVYP